MGKTHLYLGAAYDHSDYYKINDWQSLYWWDGEKWSADTACLKNLCRVTIRLMLKKRSNQKVACMIQLTGDFIKYIRLPIFDSPHSLLMCPLYPL